MDANVIVTPKYVWRSIPQFRRCRNSHYGVRYHKTANINVKNLSDYNSVQGQHSDLRHLKLQKSFSNHRWGLCKWGPYKLTLVAMTTNFGTKRAITRLTIETQSRYISDGP